MPTRLRLPLALLFMLCPALLAIPGCATGPTAYERAITKSTPPEDFTLSITVLNPQPKEPVDAITIGVRPARYIVEADRVLHAATGAAATADVYPPIARTLSDDQMATLWQTFRQSSLAQPKAGGEVSRAPDPSELAPGATMIVVSYSAQGVRKTLALTPSSTGWADAQSLTRTVAGMAWLR